MSVTGRRKTTIGLDHSGKPHDGAFVPADHPRAMASHPHAFVIPGAAEKHTQHVHADLGVQAKPKRALQVAPPISGGMQAKSRRTGEYFHNAGGTDLSRYDADGPGPLSGAPVAKRLAPVKIAPTMRSRTTPALSNDLHLQLGKMLLDEARSNSASDDAAYFGSLPDSTSEN